jgi:adenine deaminase
MRFAIRRVVEMNGGQVVVDGRRELAACPLPIAGLMSDAPLETVRDQVQAMTEAAQSLGCRLPDPLMTMSFLALPVIPALKLTDLGLIDVEKFAITPLFGE